MAASGPRPAEAGSITSGRTPAAAPTLADQLHGTTQRPLDLTLARMANDVYTTPDANTGLTGTQSEAALAADGWHRVQPGATITGVNGATMRLDPSMLDDPASGFQAAVYQRDSGEVVVAFAGTDPSSMADIGTDIAQGLGIGTRQYTQAESLATQMAATFGVENVAFTGHSLGGGLAATAAMAAGSHGVTFNAAGPSDETLRSLGYSPNEARSEYRSNGDLRSYSVAGDPLTIAGHAAIAAPVGTELRLPNTTGTRSPIELHGGGGDNQLYVEGLKSGVTQPASPGTLASLASQPLRWGIDSIGNRVEQGFDTARDVIGVGRETVGDLGRIVRQPDVLAPTRVAAELADGALQIGGALTDRALDAMGRQWTIGTDSAGQALRTVGLDSWARGLESAGGTVRRGLESAGDHVRDAADSTGDFVASLPDRAMDAAGRVVDGARGLVSKLNPF